jgi:hypothetical protein
LPCVLTQGETNVRPNHSPDRRRDRLRQILLYRQLAHARIAKNGSERIEVSSYPEILADLRSKETSGELSKRYTVAIDHVSATQQEANGRYNPTGESDFGRGNDRATREWRSIREFCRRHDFNLICTGHMKGKWEQVNGKPEQIGMQVDGSKNMEGDVSIVIHLRRIAGKFPSTAIVHKWRRDPDDPKGKIPLTFPFTIEDFAKIDGTNALKREREPIPMATEDQIKEMTRLQEIVKIPQENIDKLFKKNNAESWAELPADVMDKANAKAKELAQSAMNGNGEHEPTKKKKEKV